MPYRLTLAPCPCDSGKTLVECHGREKWIEERAAFRQKWFFQKLVSVQGDPSIQAAFRSAHYKSQGADEAIASHGALIVTAIKSAWPKEWYTDLTVGDIVPPDEILPQNLCIYATRNISFESGETVNAGLYKTTIREFGIVEGKLSYAMIRVTSITGTITTKGERQSEIQLENGVFWHLLMDRVVFVRSELLLEQEVFKYEI